MKKIFALVVALVAAVSVNAQSAGDKFFKPMVGATLSKYTSVDETKMKVGLVAGAELGYFATNQLAFTGGLLVSMQGSGYEDTSVTKDYSTTATYINVPLLIEDRAGLHGQRNVKYAAHAAVHLDGSAVIEQPMVVPQF